MAKEQEEGQRKDRQDQREKNLTLARVDSRTSPKQRNMEEIVKKC